MQDGRSAGWLLHAKIDLSVGDFIVIHIDIHLIAPRRDARTLLIQREVGFALTGSVDIQQRWVEIIFCQRLLHAHAQYHAVQSNQQGARGVTGCFGGKVPGHGSVSLFAQMRTRRGSPRHSR
ncbi:hypothetical protein D3C75_512660 [compost metagenome]